VCLVVILHVGWPGKVPDTTWQERVLLAKHERAHLDLATLPVAFNAEGYPYPSGRAVLRWSIDQVGADGIMRGADYPLVLKYCTYPQTLDFLRGPDAGLTEEERTAIFGDNATRLLAGWESR
jgi:predicted TIM-barrel fold metal-dependent hydrolase